jgi:hypothetical protein
MNVLLGFLLWCLLLVIAWPVALLSLVLAPFVWLVALPFRLLGLVLAGLFSFVQALVLLPARVLGWKPPAV